MCGICGVLDNREYARSDPVIVRKMCSALSHRGPDDEGVYVKDGHPAVALGHRRLSIIDLSAAGHQPMSNESGSVVVALNGEIYNYRELRADLEKKGHIFRSHTDTEAVVHLYEDHGKECVKFLRGMFAFAVWDNDRKLLMLARDRAGKKPLFYRYADSVFCFASELAAMMASGLINKDVDRQAIHRYLTFGYIPAPFTIYKGVFKLPPAHTLIYKDGKVAIERYWRLDYTKKLNISERDAAKELLRLLEDAVRIRLRSDVPLGAFLSGGIDSSTVVALMSRLCQRKVKTFSIGFEESGFNELRFARKVAERYGTEHHEFIVKPNALEVLPLLVERYGEPYADSSCIPTYYVARETKKHVTVALNGDGADEFFAGYERYQGMVLSELYHRLPPIVRNAVSGLFRLFPDSIDPKNRLRNIKRFFSVIDLPTRQRYLRWIGVFDTGLKDAVYSDLFRSEMGDSDPGDLLSPFLEDRSSGLEIIDRVLTNDVNLYLPDDLLVKADIATMANALEARSPFLDQDVMEFACRLPAAYKVKGMTKKYILKKAIADLLPSENIYRRKMGFGVPVGEWFRGDLAGLMQDTVLSERALRRGYFKPDAVRGLVRRHIDRRADFTFQLWALLMLELWHERFVDR